MANLRQKGGYWSLRGYPAGKLFEAYIGSNKKVYKILDAFDRVDEQDQKILERINPWIAFISIHPLSGKIKLIPTTKKYQLEYLKKKESKNRGKRRHATERKRITIERRKIKDQILEEYILDNVGE